MFPSLAGLAAALTTLDWNRAPIIGKDETGRKFRRGSQRRPPALRFWESDASKTRRGAAATVESPLYRYLLILSYGNELTFKVYLP